MTELSSTTSDVTDAELITAVRAGDLASYGVLFARHREAATRLARQLIPGPDADDLVAEAFSRVMTVLQDGKGPDEFFRAYLLTSIRRLHIDRIRAGKRLRTTGDEAELDRAVEFVDPAEMKFEQQAAAEAFSSLPERWQLVLWHLDVEGQKPAQVAPLLGMSANSVSALAYRAREGLRAAYLQSHLAPSLDEACKVTTGLLGQYVRKSLRMRDTATVENHLDTCTRCSGLHLELVEVNGNLSGLLAPALLGAAATGYLGATGSLASVGAAFGSVPGRLQSATSNSPATVAAVGAATLAVVGGVIGLAVVASGDEAPPTVRTQPPAAAPSSAPPASSAPTTPAPSKEEPDVDETDDADLAVPPPLTPTPVVTTPPADHATPTTPSPTTKPTPRPTKTPRPTPTPTTPTPTPTPTPDPVPTDYAVSLGFTNEGFMWQRRLSVAVASTGDAPAGAELSLTLAFSAQTGDVTYRGGLGADWSCGPLVTSQVLTTLTCTRSQTGSTVPALEFSLHGQIPSVTATLSEAGQADPTPTDNTATATASPWAAP